MRAIIIAGIIIRILFWHTTPVTGDASFHYSIAQYIANTGSIPVFEYQTGPDPFWWPPLFHISAAFVFAVSGVVELTPLLFGIAGIFAFRRFCMAHYEKNADTATAILSFLPFHIYYSSIGYLETLMFLLCVGAFHFYLNHLKTKSVKDLIFSCIICALCAGTHYHGFVPLMGITGHLALSRKKTAIAFLVAGLMLSSPWYVRNHIVFGNPIWPKVHGGFYPHHSGVASEPASLMILNLLDPERWSALFLEFWVGAPNSGEDFWENTGIGRDSVPFFTFFLLLWLLMTIAATATGFWGFLRAKNDSSAQLALIVFFASLLPFSANGLARMFIAAIPFALAYMAAGFSAWGFRKKHILAAIACISFVGVSYAYSYTYMDIRSRLNPFFDMIGEDIPSDAGVIMPHNVQECLYYTGKKCIRIGGVAGMPYPTEENIDIVLKDNDIGFVCCTSFWSRAYKDHDRIICERFADEEPVIEHLSGDLWGRCWKT